MTARQTTASIVELDGDLFHIAGQRLVRIDDLREIPGDKWLLTDFQEGMSRVMTVEGPAKYAELLVRRKLQETGEFEEPVDIFTHWKKKRGKNTTEVFFTAVPTRLTQFYIDELGRLEDIVLVFAMHGVLWNMATRTASKSPVAVVLRHHRFAEVVVGSRDQVYFANRCVSFDTEKEQIDTLWETVRSDIESVEQEHRVTVGNIIHINWLNADESPPWPEEWQRRLVVADRESLQLDADDHLVSWSQVIPKQPAGRSVSPFREKLFHYAKRWAPAFNMGLVLLTVVLLIAMISQYRGAYQLKRHTENLQQQIGQIQMRFPKETLDADFDGLLKFVGQMDSNTRLPSFQQMVDDLTQSFAQVLQLHHMKIDVQPDQVRLELSGEIDAAFDRAHGGYQQYLNRLTALGYRVDESRFETRIRRSQVVLKLSRPAS